MNRFIPTLKPGVTVSRNVNGVKDLIREEMKAWNVQLIRQIFGHSSIEAIHNITFPPRPGPDLPLLIHNNKGNITAKTAYSFIKDSRGPSTSPLTPIEWREFWKLKLMLWKVAVDALLLQGTFGRWSENYNGEGSLCPLCKSHVETASHLLLNYTGSILTWWNGPWPISTAPFQDRPI